LAQRHESSPVYGRSDAGQRARQLVPAPACEEFVLEGEEAGVAAPKSQAGAVVAAGGGAPITVMSRSMGRACAHGRRNDDRGG